jgi:hypothetical protein
MRRDGVGSLRRPDGAAGVSRQRYDPLYKEKVRLVAKRSTMSYRKGSSSEPPTSGVIWSLIAISTCACWCAVVSSQSYREQKKKREFGLNGYAGRRLPSSSREMGDWRTISIPRFGSSPRSGSAGGPGSWNVRIMPATTGVKDVLSWSRWLTPTGIIEAAVAPLLRLM